MWGYVCYKLLRKQFKMLKTFLNTKKIMNYKKKTMKKIVFPFFASFFVSLTVSTVSAQNKDTNVKTDSQGLPKDSIVVKDARKADTENRNVMLNAENNTGPRSVNIGLPFRGDITILENDVPVVYNFWPTIPTSVWRNNSSLAGMGLLSFGESALTQGRVGYAVQSNDRNASSSFKGYASIYVNSFGSSIYDATFTGNLGKKGWGYTLSAYECFDRGAGTDWQYTPWTDRTEMIKVGITKKYNKGYVRVLYKFSESNAQLMRYNPLVYEGNGKTKPIDRFKLGQDSYVLEDGKIPYYDAITGQPGFADLGSGDWSTNLAHTFYLIGEHTFANKMKLEYSTMYQNMKASSSVAFPLSLLVKDPDQFGNNSYQLHNSNTVWNGSVQSVISQMMPKSDNNYLVARAELTKKINKHDLRLGMNYQYSYMNYATNSGFFNQTVEANPQLLDMYATVPGVGKVKATNAFGLLPASAGGYGSTIETTTNKLAIYFSDKYEVTKSFSLNYGARFEYASILDNQNPYVNDFAQDRPFVEHKFDNLWNKVFTVDGIYKLTGTFGLLADVTYNSWYNASWDYPYKNNLGNAIPEPDSPAGTKPLQNVPITFETKVANFGGGVFWNLGDKFSLVSKLTYITKDGNSASQSITNPANPSQRATFDPIFYDISTKGWTTDIVSRPFKNFSIHYLLTLQNPQYKNYKYSAFDVTYDYSNNYLPELSRTLMEIDPSYTFKDGAVKLWFSLRYFGKQYGNPTNQFTYNGWWENFGGVDYRMSRNVSFKLQVVNFLNQEGVKGVMQGADQITDATPYEGRKIVANGIRPRTIELTATFKF